LFIKQLLNALGKTFWHEKVTSQSE